MIKTLIAFILGAIVGALFLYSFLWYQVYNKAISTWCQIYTGPPTVEMREQCKNR